MFTKLKGPLTLLTLLLCVVAVAYAWFVVTGAPQTLGEGSVVEEFVPGPPSPEVVAQLEKSRGFEVFISYTDSGFEPREAMLKRGESVRFTNNSSRMLWIGSLGSEAAPLYPGTSDCGTSLFDTCKALKPRDFWEFTFERAGEWVFVNNLKKSDTGLIHAQ